MIYIAPGKMVPTGHVIEFIAEITIPIVEVEMQQEVREGKKENNEQAIREERLPLIFEGGRLIGGDFHLGTCRYAGVLKRLRSFDSLKEACRR